MKTSMSISKMMITMVFLCVCGFVSADNRQSDYIIEDQVENGLVIERVAYLPSDRGTLSPVQKYVFAYEKKEMISRKSYMWSKKKSEWVKREDMIFSRNEREVTAERKLWNASGRLLSNEKMVYLTDKAKNYEPQFVFTKDLQTNNWILKNGRSLISQK